MWLLVNNCSKGLGDLWLWGGHYRGFIFACLFYSKTIMIVIIVLLNNLMHPSLNYYEGRPPSLCRPLVTKMKRKATQHNSATTLLDSWYTVLMLECLIFYIHCNQIT